MLKYIRQNPYCVLGITTGSKLKERTARISKIKAYSSVGKKAEFPLDLPYLPGEILRNAETAEKAAAALTVAEECLPARLTWFYENDHVDTTALEHARNGNPDKAREILRRRKKFSSAVDLAVLCFLQNDDAEGMAALLGMIRDPGEFAGFLEDFRDKTGLNVQFTANDVSRVLLDLMNAEWGATELERLLRQAAGNVSADLSWEMGYVRQKTAQIPAEELRKIAERYSLPENEIAGGNRGFSTLMTDFRGLHQDALPVLRQLKAMLPEDDPLLYRTGSLLQKIMEQYGIAAKNRFDDPPTESQLDQLKDLYSKCLDLSVSDIFADHIQEEMSDLEITRAQIEAGRQMQLISQLLDENMSPGDLVNYGLPLLSKILAMSGDHSAMSMACSAFFVVLHNKIHERLNAAGSAMEYAYTNSTKIMRLKEFGTAAADSRDQILRSLQFLRENDLKISKEAADAIFQTLQQVKELLAAPVFGEIFVYATWSYSPENYATRQERQKKAKEEEERRRQQRLKEENAQRERMASKDYQSGPSRTSSSSGDGPCYIATLVYGDYDHPQVRILRRFRDRVLLTSRPGRLFVRCYYRWSPRVVRMLRGHNFINFCIRKLLDGAIHVFSKSEKN